jgi:hypothetical protein
MPRKRPPAVPSRATPAAGTNVADRETAAPPAVSLLLFSLAALIFVLLYYTDAPDQFLAQRQQTLAFLLAPDELFLIWCGGKLSYFSIFDRWPIVLLAGTTLVAAWLAGRLALRALGVTKRLTRLEQTVFALGVGLNLLSLYALAVGLAGGLQQRWLFIAPLVLLALANVWVPRVACPAVPPSTAGQASSATLDKSRWLCWLLLALPYVAIMLLGAMLPPWDYDVREYHLQAPKEWFQNGRIDFLSHNIYANMPLGSELTALWGMALAGGKDAWWWGAMAGKTVMACYSLFAAAALFAFGRRIHSLAAGVIAGVLYLTAPWICALGTAGYNEGPVALYALLAIFALWLATDGQNASHASRFILLAGFCGGSAIACKYPPLLFVVIPLAVWSLVIGHWSFAALLRPTRSAPLHASLFLIAALAACGLWFAKNWAQTNNPTYPLLYSVFDGRTRTAEKNTQWMKVHSPQPDASGHRFSPRQFIDQIAWNGWRTMWASLTIPPLALMALWSRAHWRLIAALASWVIFVFVTWWLFTHRLDRFLVLLLPAAALIAAIGVFAVDHRAWRAATLGFLACGAIAQFPFVTLHPDDRYFAPLEALRRDDRELGLQGHRVDAAHRWLNENAKSDERVLLLGDAEPFDLEIPAVYNTCFDDCQFTRIFKDHTRDERLAILRAENIAYVFCSWSHLARYRSPGNYGYTSDYPTPQLVHDELIGEQRLLIPVPIDVDPQQGELFRVAEQ